MSRLRFNVKDVGDSTISGLGVFASKFMPAGTILDDVYNNNYYKHNNFDRNFITLVNDEDIS